MDNKYYQPTTEEFFVGFKFEFLKNTDYEKHKFMCISQFTFDDLPELCKLSRVKYLDEQDILDLGFEKHSSKDNKYLKYSCEVYSNDKLNITLGHYPEINKISIITRDLSKSELALLSNWDDKSVNLITIKNKNELIKLLKQL